MSVCIMYVCYTKTFDSLDVGSSFLFIRYIFTGYTSSSYMQVTWSRSRSGWSLKLRTTIFGLKKQ